MPPKDYYKTDPEHFKTYQKEWLAKTPERRLGNVEKGVV